MMLGHQDAGAVAPLALATMPPFGGDCVLVMTDMDSPKYKWQAFGLSSFSVVVRIHDEIFNTLLTAPIACIADFA